MAETMKSDEMDSTPSSNCESKAQKQAIEEELQRIEESATYSAQTQFERSKHWRSVNYLLGIPTSVFATIAASMILAEAKYQIIAAILSLLAAAGGAILTILNAAHRMNQATASANAYLEIQTTARQARLIDLPNQSAEEARQVLGELTSRRDEQNRMAEVPSRRAYIKGKRNIAEGGQNYDIDQSREDTL